MTKLIDFVHIKKIGLLAILLLIVISETNGQDVILITGKIVDGANQPIENVAIAVEGSDELPEYSDVNGEFTLLAQSNHAWLNISPSNEYKPKRIFLNGRDELKIYLIDNDLKAADDEILIFGQEVLRRNLTSSFSTLNVEDLDQTSSLSLDQFMKGKVPGMHVTSRSGLPGSGASLMLRGIRSINTTSEPLYIVDGVPLTSVGVLTSVLDGYDYNPLLVVNMFDVSKVTVVKDPSITASFGSKASNGLILIETLDPSATETIIELDYTTGVSLVPENSMPQLSANEHKTLLSEVLYSSEMNEEEIVEQYPNLYLTPEDDRFIDYQHNTNWQSLIFDQAQFTNANLQAKGGDEIARYGLSFGYHNYEGIIRSTGYDGYNLKFTGLLNIYPWLKMNAGVSMNYSEFQLKESAESQQTNPIYSALAKSPMINPYVYDDAGQELNSLINVDELGVSNPQAIIENFEAKNNNFHFISTLGAEATLNNSIALSTNFGITYNVLKENVFKPNQGMELYYNDEAINVTELSNNSLISFNNNTFLKINKKWNVHNFTSNFGVNTQTNEFQFDYGLTKNSPANDQYRTLQDGVDNLRELRGDNRSWNWLSIYENFTYSYLDKYIINGSVSLDGSSRIGDNARNTTDIMGVPFGLFYGGGLGWRLSNEQFLKNISWLEELKIRASYGKTGNDDIGEANATRYYSSIKYRESVGLYPGLVYNEELTYETVNQFNTGIDVSLWGARMSFNADYYNSVTKDMLIFTRLDSYYGYEYRPVNAGEIQNNGIDIGLFFRIIDIPDFTWDIEGNLSTVNNEVTYIENDVLITPVLGAEIANLVGEQANSFYGYLFEGVYLDASEAEIANLTNDKFIPFQAGDAKFADLSGPEGVPDGVINDFDKTILGSATPDFFGGLSSTIAYKRWSLNAFVQFEKGNEIFNYIRFKNESLSGLENQSKNVLSRWQYEGQITDVPRAAWNDPMGNASFSSRWIEDGSYLRIKDISLAYTIDNEFLTFRNAKIYVSAINLITFSNYLGYDPEFAYSRSQRLQGVDYGLTPQSRQFLVGIKLGL